MVVVRPLGAVAKAIVALVAAASIIVLGSDRAVMAAGSDAIVIEGPGLDRPVEVDFRRWPLDQFELATQLGARFNARAGDVGPLLAEAPIDDLGPRWTVTWIAAGPAGASREHRSTRQDVYPDAARGPLVHTPPAQHLVEGNVGWYEAPSELRDTLRSVGVPLEHDSPSDWATRAYIVAVGCLVAVLAVWRFAVSGNRRTQSAEPLA